MHSFSYLYSFFCSDGGTTIEDISLRISPFNLPLNEQGAIIKYNLFEFMEGKLNKCRRRIIFVPTSLPANSIWKNSIDLSVVPAFGLVHNSFLLLFCKCNFVWIIEYGNGPVCWEECVCCLIRCQVEIENEINY